MKGQQVPGGKLQFSLVYEQGRAWADSLVAVRAKPNGLSVTRFGFVASKRVGKAATRNLVKRRLREITRHLAVAPGWDIVINARIPAATSGYRELEKSVRRLLERAALVAGENEGSSAETD